MDDEKSLPQEVTETAAASESTAEKPISAFQKFMKALISDDKEQATQKNSTGQATEKSYSEGELKQALEAESGRLRAEQLEKERLLKLSPDEREKAEKETTSKRIAELELKLMQKDLREQAASALSNEGYPIGLAELLSYGSKEEMSASLEKTTDIFKSCLAEAVNQRLKGKTPVGLAGNHSAESTFREQIAKNIRGGF